ncbi:hypothetical protein CONPUDRAFT_169810 [Coniophora puteana RWD-64-598 SS2]|uniref:Oxidoreductase AflY n=1 Tax=Coniophora puteana (strain RWD-64-598) TaxID=741705 RepID=A0A5M3M6E1_CONPW|nr:uncharacterized protein CONPUDRAFT_169810 [Coniophora puteana RWD-64-598 SS2]EIW74908.1 hypothetical protein CONPUDRAFT_169810 [Coniophora puteana RWD-64-598 SS2]
MTSPVVQDFEAFFPEPSTLPSTSCPQRLPGITAASNKAIVFVMRDNHQKYDVFWDDRKFHNHVTHRAFALYAMGAQGPLIEGYYKADAKSLRPAFASPEEITEQNYCDHLEDAKYYSAYVNFFANEVAKHGAIATVEKFAFSEEYNTTKAWGLAHLMAGVYHPMIHIGNGLEFGIPGLIVEGLAMGAVNDVFNVDLLGPSFFKIVPTLDTATQAITSKLSSLLLDTKKPSSEQPRSLETTVFDVLARVRKNDRLAPHKSSDIFTETVYTLVERGGPIRELADAWSIDLSRPGEVERKVEELIWMATLIYGVGGWSEKEFQAEFFFLHIVTSAIFLPSYTAHLSPRSQVLLLRAYLVMALVTYVSRGRPELRIPAFFAGTIPGSTLTPGNVSISYTPEPETKDAAANPNPWLALVQSALVHEADHYPKGIRALLHGAQAYGARPKGYWSGELEGIEDMDGTLFLRTAELTAYWARDENQERGIGGERWSFEGFGV